MIAESGESERDIDGVGDSNLTFGCDCMGNVRCAWLIYVLAPSFGLYKASRPPTVFLKRCRAAWLRMDRHAWLIYVLAWLSKVTTPPTDFLKHCWFAWLGMDRQAWLIYALAWSNRFPQALPVCLWGTDRRGKYRIEYLRTGGIGATCYGNPCS